MANNPTFDDLMEDRHRTPRRTPVLDTLAITKAVIEWFQNKSQWRMVEEEMQLPRMVVSDAERRADVVAFNYTEHKFYIVEVKVGWNDFVRDRKFRDYRKWCNWFAFAVPEELAACARRRMDDIPGWYEGVGLLVIPNDFSPRRLVRRAKEYDMPEQAYALMVERWGRSCWGRLIGARQEAAAMKFEIDNLKSDLKQVPPPVYPSPE